MLREYARKLASNMPAVQPFDLVLGGGIFNGSYLVGVCELLDAANTPIGLVSGASIGSLVGLLFVAGRLDLFAPTYESLMTEFKQTKSFHVGRALVLGLDLPADIVQRCDKRLIITYYSVKRKCKVTRRRYTTDAAIRHAVLRSCCLPGLTDSAPGYLDGFSPFVPSGPNRVLFVDLHSTWRKCAESFLAHNERTNFHRMLEGLLDAHAFFVKGYATELCSYVDQWTSRQRFDHWLRSWVERLVIYILLNCPPLGLDKSTVMYRMAREGLFALVDNYVV